MYADPALDRKPELLGQRGGAFYSEAAVALLASLVSDAGDTQVVNVRNARHAAVPGRRRGDRGAGGDRRGRRRAGAGRRRCSPLMRGLIAHVSAYEELAVDAALRGGGDAGHGRAARPPADRPVRAGRPAGGPAARGEPGLPALGQRLVSQAAGARLPAVLAIDGGNSKTEVALVAADGTVLARPRGPGMPGRASVHDQAMRVLGDLAGTVALAAGRTSRLPGGRAACPPAWPTPTCPTRRSSWTRLVRGAGLGSDTTTVANDTFAVLRAGLDGAGRAALGRRRHLRRGHQLRRA